MNLSKKYYRNSNKISWKRSLLWAKNKGAIKIAPWSNTHEIIIKIPYVFRITSIFCYGPWKEEDLLSFGRF